MYKYFQKHTFPFLWAKCLREYNMLDCICGICMFNFVRNCQAVSQSDCTILHSYHLYMRDPESLNPIQCLVLSLCFWVILIHVVLVCVSLMVNRVVPFCLCLFIICISEPTVFELKLIIEIFQFLVITSFYFNFKNSVHPYWSFYTPCIYVPLSLKSSVISQPELIESVLVRRGKMHLCLFWVPCCFFCSMVAVIMLYFYEED